MTHEILGPTDFRGYGREYEKQYTTQEIRGSTGHHRIITYDFCGLKFLICHETDTYLKTNAITNISKQKVQEDHSFYAIWGDQPQASSCKAATPTSSQLQVKHGGHMVPFASTIEIKTRTSTRPLNISEIALQLWVSQTPKLVRAHHYRGMFEKPAVEDVAEAFKAWETANQEDLGKLSELIRIIILVVKANGGKAEVVYDMARDKLLIKKAERANMLPADLYLKWNDDGSKVDGEKLARP